MQKAVPISGNLAFLVQNGPNSPICSEDAPDGEKSANIEQLRDFLMAIDKTEPDEIFTMADKITSNLRENADNGVLSAEAILNNSVMSPTGAQVISTLQITPTVVESFEPIRHITLSAVHKRLAEFIPALQESYGRRDLWPFASNCNGYRAILDPLMLAGYVPYIEILEDLRDEQIVDCFHPFQEVDGYPTIQGMPLWERQEWERIEYYNLFKLYRDMRYAFYNESDALLVNRSMNVLAKATRMSASLISYLSVVYNWRLRVSLYDAWMALMQQRRVSVKRSMMLDRHTKISQALIQKAYSCLSKQADKLAPKEALEMLKLGLAYERISLGLSGDKPETTQAGNAAPLLSIVTQNNNTTGPMQVNNELQPEQQLQNNMKKPDTLLSVLTVLQRSGAFDTMLQSAGQDTGNDDTISVENVVVSEVTSDE